MIRVTSYSGATANRAAAAAAPASRAAPHGPSRTEPGSSAPSARRVCPALLIPEAHGARNGCVWLRDDSAPAFKEFRCFEGQAELLMGTFRSAKPCCVKACSQVLAGPVWLLGAGLTRTPAEQLKSK